MEELSERIKLIKESIPSTMSDADASQLQNSLDTISVEIINPTPKKDLLKRAITGLTSLKGTVEFAAAVAALDEFVQPFLG